MFCNKPVLAFGTEQVTIVNSRYFKYLVQAEPTECLVKGIVWRFEQMSSQLGKINQVLAKELQYKLPVYIDK